MAKLPKPNSKHWKVVGGGRGGELCLLRDSDVFLRCGAPTTFRPRWIYPVMPPGAYWCDGCLAAIAPDVAAELRLKAGDHGG